MADKPTLAEMLQLATDDKYHLAGVLAHYRDHNLGDDPVRERQLQVREGIVTILKAMSKNEGRSRRFIQELVGGGAP